MKKLSTTALHKLETESGTRVLTKSRPEKESNAHEEFVRMEILLVQTLKEITKAIGHLKVDIPEQKAPQVTVMTESKPRIKHIYAKNIQRDGQNRLESVDFDVKYEDSN